MKRYTIEIKAGKIFSYEEGAQRRLLKSHGDEFYPAENFADYWSWFAEETAADELEICFICSADELSTLERLKDSAQVTAVDVPATFAPGKKTSAIKLTATSAEAKDKISAEDLRD